MADDTDVIRYLAEGMVNDAGDNDWLELVDVAEPGWLCIAEAAIELLRSAPTSLVVAALGPRATKVGQCWEKAPEVSPGLLIMVSDRDRLYDDSEWLFTITDPKEQTDG